MSKVILITGTSSGFGKLTAATLAKDGHTIIATMRETKGKNQASAEELGAINGVEIVEMDINTDASVEAAFESVFSKHPKLDVLINNAAVTGFGPAEGYSIHLIKKMFETNFFGVLRTYDAVLPKMRAAKDGLIINLSTGAGGFALPYMVPYFASKFAMETLVEGINSELRTFGIENVSIPCGVYPTGMAEKGGFNADNDAIVGAYTDYGPRMEGLGASLYGKMKDFNMDPQTIADGIKHLVDMEKGTRPLRYPLDAIAQGTDQEFIDAKASIKVKWAAKYGFDI
ncbi:SDR family NAD(P)-dependent oxidoreductase [Dyadobacter sp. 3J3]|uniref:SDR family NAD(P)-dependent oxidoreductase n=1 Tax=Dyadobacter sp. 3J3 TaxID=2606600 RepID=UPI00135A4028|nr:SDR family NAD(P)-dependent oxidoreductase [Dyadobacter sp. 3J3]